MKALALVAASLLAATGIRTSLGRGSRAALGDVVAYWPLGDDGGTVVGLLADGGPNISATNPDGGSRLVDSAGFGSLATWGAIPLIQGHIGWANAFRQDGGTNTPAVAYANETIAPAALVDACRSKDWTASFWFRPVAEASAGVQMVFDLKAQDPDTEVNNRLCDIQLASGLTGVLVQWEHGAGTNDFCSITVPALTQDAWNHVAIRFTHQAGTQVTCEVFTGGTSRGTSVQANGPTGGTSATMAMQIGASINQATGAAASQLHGDLDELVFYNRALSDAEISALAAQ